MSDYDVIAVGSGAGAGALVNRLAPFGTKILPLERLRAQCGAAPQALAMVCDVHRVIVVGGGFGGLFAIRALRHAAVKVTLVDRVNRHLFQPLLYQLATGILSEREVGPPIRGVLRRQRNLEVEMAEVTDFDLERQAQ